jgi:predicted ribosomally synthesized peptide with nif11-like leader
LELNNQKGRGIMSIENVKAFYARLAIDEAFRAEVEGARTQEKCAQTLKQSGYDFTQKELEDYTAQLLQVDSSDELKNLDEKELVAVLGGFQAIIQPGTNLPLIYGGPPGSDWLRPFPPQQMYGVVLPPE